MIPMSDEANPDLRLQGFSLWCIAREFPQATDFWDGNWLKVRALVDEDGARVDIEGMFLRNTDIKDFLVGLESIYRDLRGTAELKSLEPNLHLTIECPSIPGHFAMTVEITPDHMEQRHRYWFGFDQTFLPPVISSCRRILDRFPVIGI